jgi:hypothetical protein
MRTDGDGGDLATHGRVWSKAAAPGYGECDGDGGEGDRDGGDREGDLATENRRRRGWGTEPG